jgi:hypothetical protein
MFHALLSSASFWSFKVNVHPLINLLSIISTKSSRNCQSVLLNAHSSCLYIFLMVCMHTCSNYKAQVWLFRDECWKLMALHFSSLVDCRICCLLWPIIIQTGLLRIHHWEANKLQRALTAIKGTASDDDVRILFSLLISSLFCSLFLVVVLTMIRVNDEIWKEHLISKEKCIIVSFVCHNDAITLQCVVRGL